MAGWDDVAFWSLPIGARPDPMMRDEMGRPVMRDYAGNTFVLDDAREPVPLERYLDWQEQHRVPVDPVAASPGNALRAIAAGVWDGISAPGRAARGEPVTYGDAWGMALDAGLLAAPMPAPAGALRSGALRALPDETPAEAVARLLREGRAADVTDDLLAQADPQELAALYEGGATGVPMPMDEASRMARAQDMGFGYVRRTPSQESPFNDVPYAMFVEGDLADPDGAFDRVHHYGGGMWVGRPDVPVQDVQKDIVRSIRSRGLQSDYQTTAAQLAREADPENIVDSAGMWDSMDLARAVSDDLYERGVGAVSTQDGMVAWDPRNIRSRFARFDPRLAHLLDYGAGLAGGAFMGGLLSAPMTSDDRNALAAYLEGI